MTFQASNDAAQAPLVSVVIPCFNSSATIEQTIESVLAQSLTDLEVIVCDDGSTDATADLVDAIRQRDSRVLFSATDANFGGPAAPRNRGIGLSRGEWIAFLDSDDLWMEHKLKVQIAVASKIRADFICSGIQDFWGELRDDELQGRPAEEDWGPVTKWLAHRKLLLNNTIPTSTVLVKNHLLRKNGFQFIEDQSFIAVEDYELWLKILSLPDISAAKISRPLVFYRRAETSISKNKFRMFLKVRRVVNGELKSRSPIIRQLLMIFYSASYVLMSFYYRLIKRSL